MGEDRSRAELEHKVRARRDGIDTIGEHIDAAGQDVLGEYGAVGGDRAIDGRRRACGVPLNEPVNVAGADDGGWSAATEYRSSVMLIWGRRPEPRSPRCSPSGLLGLAGLCPGRSACPPAELGGSCTNAVVGPTLVAE